MNCPQGHGPLAIAERQGVEIDYCPQCRGIWLDRGEVDKIIEREVATYGPLPAQQRGSAAHPEPFIRDERPTERHYDERRRYDDDDDRRRFDRDDDRDDRYRGKKKRRESFLSDLLDF
jgi:Zn-finger nucleic acid-binding protein